MSRPIIYAVDFDGTLVENNFPFIGKPNEEVIEYVKERKEKGAIIILWTTRQNSFLRDALDFCAEHDIPIDCANKNWKGLDFDTSPKIFADVYIDDRAYNPFGVVDDKLQLYMDEEAIAEQGVKGESL